MTYTPTTITKKNMEWAIRKNLDDIFQEAQRKLTLRGMLPVKGIKANNFSLTEVADPVDDSDLVNLKTAREYING